MLLHVAAASTSASTGGARDDKAGPSSFQVRVPLDMGYIIHAYGREQEGERGAASSRVQGPSTHVAVVFVAFEHGASASEEVGLITARTELIMSHKLEQEFRLPPW